MIKNLQRLMREKRAELDPRLLALARKAAERAHGIGDTVPYDKKSAEKAIGLFLDANKDFRAKLLDFMSRKSH